jgi:hypothetical protein
VRKADSLPPSSADVTESGSLDLPQPSGPHRAVMAMLIMEASAMLTEPVYFLRKAGKGLGDAVKFNPLFTSSCLSSALRIIIGL